MIRFANLRFSRANRAQVWRVHRGGEREQEHFARNCGRPHPIARFALFSRDENRGRCACCLV